MDKKYFIFRTDEGQKDTREGKTMANANLHLMKSEKAKNGTN